MNNNNSKKSLVVLVALAVLLLATVLFLKSSVSTSAFIWKLSNAGEFLLPLVAISALIDSINPCAFSVLILTIAFLFSIGVVRARILKVGGVYILGIFSIYVLIGLGILQALHLFNTPHFMAKVGAWLLIVLGVVNLINEFFPAFPIKLKIPQAAHHKIAQLMEKGSMPAAFFLGVLVGLCEFPCTGGPYLMVLGLLHDTSTYAKGLAYLFFYNLIFVLPLIVILAIAGNKQVVEKVRSWQQKEKNVMRFAGGLAAIVLGVVILLL